MQAKTYLTVDYFEYILVSNGKRKNYSLAVHL